MDLWPPLLHPPLRPELVLTPVLLNLLVARVDHPRPCAHPHPFSKAGTGLALCNRGQVRTVGEVHGVGGGGGLLCTRTVRRRGRGRTCGRRKPRSRGRLCTSTVRSIGHH